jgi:signal peptidase I
MSRRGLMAIGRPVAIVAAVVWFMILRPQWLGGPAMYVVVRGDSMLPAYQNGDLLVIVAQAGYSVGEPAAYRVPPGEVGAGHIVFHRIISSADGHYTLQGDNNAAPDPSTPSYHDMVGAVVVQVPHLGTLIASALSPTIAGGLAAALVVMYGVARPLPPPARRRQTVTVDGA